MGHMNTPPTTPTASATDQPDAAGPPEDDLAVDVRGLRVTYGDFEAVRGIDLQAHRGELLAVLGTNGAGKTTTLDVLGGRRGADQGRIRVLGMDPHRQQRTIAARTGVMLQSSALPDELTPTEFLQLWDQMTGGGSSLRPITEQLARVGLAHRSDVRIGRLSGGERRRLDLATALWVDPELLFLDEPTAGLDPESRADTWVLIHELLRAGTTVVLTTHYLEEADALADRLVIMHEGRVAVAGTLEEVVGGRDARIRCEVDPDVSIPREAFIGHAEARSDRARQRIELRTPALADDLRTLLGWAQSNAIELRRLHASEQTLADVFHDVRGAATTVEEADT